MSKGRITGAAACVFILVLLGLWVISDRDHLEFSADSGFYTEPFYLEIKAPFNS